MPLLITFEGGEAAGKTTQIARLTGKLTALNLPHLVTREPGGTSLGEELRHLLKHHDAGKNMFPEAELLLFAAARAQHARELITPALLAGKIVLCDRYLDSTTAYQGAARRLPPEQVAHINSFAIGQTRPDITFYLDLDPLVARERILSRNKNANSAPLSSDRMESEPLDFYQRVRAAYLEIARAEPARVHVIDAAQPVETVENALWAILSPKLKIS
ncbi:dTMP kinase [Oscillatoria amoena NRMC-F 0135]|nr:dTMP kinase [Oscillatoria laete-virens]MDL5046618.1 dTMP kinase [Oscillatoria amoena NRMC-F 0135]MDL5053605.1 dTMP kinase [Oscillatoria laete-virens NRMC-F 0139]